MIIRCAGGLRFGFLGACHSQIVTTNAAADIRVFPANGLGVPPGRSWYPAPHSTKMTRGGNTQNRAPRRGWTAESTIERAHVASPRCGPARWTGSAVKGTPKETSCAVMVTMRQKLDGCSGRLEYLLLHECALSRYFPPLGPELLICPSEEYVSSNLLTSLKNIVLVSG